ncbi:MAG: sensor histidine kinase [Novosphingobium meiothermophilum]
MSAAFDPANPRVPARQVILSAAALWLCYFLLVTVRGLVVDLGDFADLLWRRGLVSVAGIVVTVACWPLLRRFDGRALSVRVAAALVIMLPAALALAAINQWAFAPVEQRLLEKLAEEETRLRQDAPALPSLPAPPTAPSPKAAPSSQVLVIGKEGRGAVSIRRDTAGNMMIDVLDEGLGPLPTPSAPLPPVPPSGSAADAARPVPATPAVSVIRKLAEKEGLWRQLTDVALGRYFLLIAWAALYLALGNGEQLRAAEYREGEYRRAAKAAELRSLRYQVNPHFLFNALNSLSALVMVGRAEQAERMIQSLSRFYRHSLAGDPTADVPLEDEIALQRHYLEIEAVRFPERLVCEFDVPAPLLSACVPGMILQPLVENSIKYGVSATTRPVTIRISAREAGGFLVLTVADDGPGAAAVAAPGRDAATIDSTGIGLANVRSRLAARFGEGVGRVESGALPAGGYATVLTMPLVRNEC